MSPVLKRLGGRAAGIDMTPVLTQAARIMPDVNRALGDNAERQRVEMDLAKMRMEVEKAKERERERLVP